MGIEPPVGKRAQHRKDRRDGFTSEAAKIFLKLGMRNTTMDDVAEQLGVSKVVVYRYFPSKTELLECILDGMAAKILESDRLPFEGYETAIRRTMRIAREDPAAFLLLTRDSRADPVMSVYLQRVLDGVTERLIQAFRDWGLKEEYALLSGSAMMAFVLNVQVYWVEHGDPDRDAEFETWAAQGMHALDRQWRKDYAISQPVRRKGRRKKPTAPVPDQ